MNTNCWGEVQYVNCCYTRGMRTLSGERGKPQKSDPVFEVLCDDGKQEIQIKILDVVPENMFSKTVREHVDIYILKPGAIKFKNCLDTILGHITSSIVLDRGDRSPRDPNSNYDQSGLPLEIDSLEAWIKVSSIKACFVPDEYTLETTREKNTNNAMPRLNVEVEKYRSRLHIGVEVDWKKISTLNTPHNSIEINIPWKECGHLLAGVNSAISKLK